MSPVFFFTHFLLRIFASESARRKFIVLATMFYGRIFFYFFFAIVRVKGLENIPKRRRDILIVANHQSNMDILLINGYYPVLKGYIAKKSLGGIFILRTWMKAMGCFFLDRESVKSGMEAMKWAMAKIKDNHPMIVFPEGHRSKGGPIADFAPGAMKMATIPGALIQPISIEGTYKCLEKLGSFPARITMTIHPVIDTKGLSKAEKSALPATLKEIIKSGVDPYIER
jgi:1-acyl-sn-glycerol-3-phosphate acyltransferase